MKKSPCRPRWTLEEGSRRWCDIAKTVNHMSGKASDITTLPGVGKTTAAKLKAAKYNTVAKIAKASASDLKKAGLTLAVAKKIHASAKAATAVKSAATSTAKKGASAAKRPLQRPNLQLKKPVQKQKQEPQQQRNPAKRPRKRPWPRVKMLLKKSLKKPNLLGLHSKRKRTTIEKGIPFVYPDQFRTCLGSKSDDSTAIFEGCLWKSATMPRRKYGRLRKTVEQPPRKLFSL